MSAWRRAQELVGRTDELAVLEDSLAAATAGRRSVVLLGGEAGIGKTRLVTEVAARHDEMAVLMGSCLGYADGGLPLAPVLAALQSWGRSRGAADAAAPFEPFQQQPGIGDQAGGRGGDEENLGRLWAFGRIAAVIDGFGADRPVLLVVDDLHWSDRTTLEFLDYLASRSDRQRLALVGTYRDTEARRPDLSRWLGEMIRGRGAIDLYLEPLGAADTAAIVRQLRGEGRPDTEIHRRSGGNPYLVELLAQGEEMAAARMPAGLTETLLARWRELPQKAAEILTPLAVLGRPAQPELIAAMVDPGLVDSVAVDDALDEGVRRGVIIQTPDRSFGFRHPLLSEIVTQAMLPGQRKRAHRAVATAIGELPGVPDGQRATDLALHSAAAGDDEATFRWSLRSADHALAAHGFPEAFDHLVAALDRWDAVADADVLAGSDRVDILVRAVHVGVLSGHSDDLLPLARAAMTAIDSDRDPVRAGGVHAQLFRSLSLAVQDPLVERAGGESILLTDGSSGPERALALGIKSLFTGLSGDADAGFAVAGRAVSMARRAGDSSVLATCLLLRGSGEVLTGRPDARADLVEALTLARSAGSLLEIAGAHAWLAAGESRAGDHDRAIDTLLAGWRECRQVGLDRGLALQLLTYAARLLRERGRWDEADRVLQELRAVPTKGVTQLKVQLEDAQLKAARGHTEEAHQLLAAAGDPDKLPLARFAVPDLDLAAVVVAAWDDRPSDLLTRALTGLGAIDAQDCGGRMLVAGARAAADIAVAARDRGDRHGIREALGAVERLTAARARLPVDPFDMGAPTGWEPEAFRATWDAEIARMTDSGGQSELWLTAAELWTARGFKPDAAYAGVRAAESLIGAGRIREAASPLRRAFQVASSVGARRLIDSATEIAQSAHIALAAPPTFHIASPAPPLDRLTRREREILGLIAAGRTNAEIGQELFISPTTASVHVSNILRKLGVTDRYAAAGLARRLAAQHPNADPGLGP